MKRRALARFLSFAPILIALTALSQQDGGYWRAVSQTAHSITGDVALSDTRLTINFVGFTISRVRALEPAELSAAFNPDPGTAGVASLYRTSIPASRKFLKKNSLCGSDDTTWMATYLSGRSLEIAFFSGDKPPVFTLEAMNNAADLCGIFTYTR
jgi:hypothetical protein